MELKQTTAKERKDNEFKVTSAFRGRERLDFVILTER